MCTLFLWSVDPSLGKIDKYSLPQETLMDLFIANLTNKEFIYGSDEIPKDVLQWKGVISNDLNEIIEIDWQFSELDGSLAFEWLPLSIVKVEILNILFTDSILGGTIDLTSLPNGLKELEISCHDFCGAIDLRSLPEKMELLDLACNKLSGPLDLTHLPAGIHSLQLHNNKFSGSTNFSLLPESLKKFNISKNPDISGDISMTCDQRANFKIFGCQIRMVNPISI